MILDEPSYSRNKPIFIPLERILDAPARFAKHTIPMFYGRIPKPPEGLDIAEMSGCPTFGFAHEPKGGATYYFVAIQSGGLPFRSVRSRDRDELAGGDSRRCSS
jgi:hypothetical protein